MYRLIEADVLKVRRRRAMVAVTAGILFAAVAIYYGVGAALDKTTDFDSAVGILALLASVAGAIFGATAGGQDIETGVLMRKMPSATSWIFVPDCEFVIM